MMDLLDRLRQMGYALTAEGGKVRCHWQGPGQPDPVEVQPLLDELRQHKAEALEALRQEQTETTRDPFDPRNHIPDGLIVCLPCVDHLDCWIARRTGTLEPEGHGLDQVEAMMDLDRLEAERGCADG